MARAKKEAALTPEERLRAALVPDWEWPYRLPENWCWTTVDKVATVVTGGTPSKNNPEYYGGDFPFFKPADLDMGRHVFNASEYLSDAGKQTCRIIPAYATAVCCIGTIGKCGFLDVEGTTNQQINSAVSKVNPLYQYYYMNTDFFSDQLKEKASATTISIVNKSKMESCYYPLAPLAEQQRIVDRIESLFAKLDEAKEKAQAVLDSFETRKAAILHKAFIGEMTAKWREAHGVGLESWEEHTIKDIAQLLSGQDFRPEQYNSSEQGIPYITGASNFLNSHVLINRWTETPVVISKCNDVLIVCKGSGYGKVIIADYQFAHIARQIMALRVEQNTNNRFLLFFLQANYKYLRDSGQGLIPGISRKVILDLDITLPCYDEQAEIVRILDDLFAKEQQAKEAAETVLEKIDLMKKSILARAFRGELGTNDPNDESAVELLKKII